MDYAIKKTLNQQKTQDNVRLLRTTLIDEDKHLVSLWST